MIIIFVKMLRKSLFIVLFLFIAASLNSCKPKGAYNPYLTAKRKPSEIQARETHRVGKKQNKMVKKQKESSRKILFGRKRAPKQ